MKVNPARSAAAHKAKTPWRGAIAVFNKRAAMKRAIQSGFVERKK